MMMSTAQAAMELGVTDRQVRRAIDSGHLFAERVGERYVVHGRQVYALKRMKPRGREWDEGTKLAALDLLSGIHAHTLPGSQLSRLKARIRAADAEVLAGILLLGKISLYRATAEQLTNLATESAADMGLVGAGLGVLVSENSKRDAARRRLPSDSEGNVVAVTGISAHRRVIEALVLCVYGGTRERSAARAWLARAQLLN